MLYLRRTVLAASLVLFVALLQPGQVFAQGKAKMWDDELPIADSYLRDRMPADALAYLRVPHVLGLIASPKGNALDSALRSEANVRNVQKLNEGISENVLEHLPMFADLRLRLFQQHLRSPIEVAAFAAPAPSALIVATLDIDSNEDFTALIDSFALVDPNMGLAAPLDENGISQLIGLPLPVQLKFDADSGRLFLNSGPAVSSESFVALLDAVDNAEEHRMSNIENRIDSSGQGMFFWIDSEQALPAAAMFMTPEDLANMQELGLEAVKSVGMGWGVANGKGRLSIIADVPVEDSREFLPYISNDLSAKAVGDPGGLFLLSIPTAEEFSRLEGLIMATAGAEAQEDWLESKAQLQEWGGVSLEEILGAIGPEFIGIFDEAGDYGAIRLRDRDLWDSIIERISEASGSSPDSKRIGGETYYHWSVPGEFGLMEQEEADEIGWLGTLLHEQRDHFYWTIDGDFLYVSSVPQPLIERDQVGAKTDIEEWLTEQQRIDASESIMMVASTSRKLPRRLYAIYIEVLQILADVSKTEIDVWSMPTPRQLRMADEGTLGFSVNLGQPYVGMELTFESTPFEFLFGGGIGGVVAAGIVAAVAVPAYQDYTTRAQIATGLSMSAALKTAVTDFHMENGRFPNAEEAEAMSVYGTGDEDVWSLEVLPDDGVIVITYSTSVAEGGEVYLEPIVEEGGFITWACSGSFEDKHLPAVCRIDEEAYDDEDY